MRFVDRIIRKEDLLLRVLKNFFGLGLQQKILICKKFGLPMNIRMNALSSETLTKLELYLSFFEYFSRDLRQAYRKSLVFHKRRGDFRGIRVFMGLPVRGQRSHTNARTVFRLSRRAKRFNRGVVVKR